MGGCVNRRGEVEAGEQRRVGEEDAFADAVGFEAEELEVIQKGAEPLAIYLDSVPYRMPSVEGGLLGMFEPARTSVSAARLAVPTATSRPPRPSEFKQP